MLAASVLLGVAPPAVASEAAVRSVSQAWGDYFRGRSLTARKALTALLETPDAEAPVVRLGVLEALLDMCIQSRADACIRDHAQAYADTAEVLAKADDGRRTEYALRAAYYFDQGRLARRDPRLTAQILDWPPWRVDVSAFPRVAIQRQALAANVKLELNDLAAARQETDKLLAMVAALSNPQEDRALVAWALTEAIWNLNAIGESDRAYGVYRAALPGLLRSLPSRSPDAVLFRLMEAGLLQEQGALEGALAALDEVATLADTTELDDDTREWLLSRALTSKAAICTILQRQDCAGQALDRHPAAALYAKAGRKPATYDEAAYLAARVLTEALGRKDATIAASALRGPLGFKPRNDLAPEIDVYRAFGAALGAPPGQARQDRLFEGGRKLVALTRQTPTAGLGAWRRPNAIEQVLIALALTQADSRRPDGDETVFALMQMAARQGSTFDADAQTLFAQAADEAERRTLHDALRIKARRDQLERRALGYLAERMVREAQGGDLSYEPRLNQLLTQASDHIAATDRGLTGRDVASAGTNLASLKPFQAVLRPGEAALSYTLVPGGVAYACVRRDLVQRRVLATDLQRHMLDSRIVQAALTAGHAPSERADAQFPAEAAVRLYDTLIRPFEGCLKPGDRILLISGASGVSLPLSALLERAPPKLAVGYDLASADWLMRRHAVSYPGSASLVVAARKAASTVTPLDFLGVGDPILDKPVAGTLDFSSLIALPETKDELEASARGFSASKLILRAAATEAAVRAEPLADYRFLSFATHGLVREELTGLDEPALVLTPASSDRDNDGLLTASEIADLNLAARFVALSACNTANRDLSIVSGELAALSSAFAMAGAPSVLGTLWPVETETGKRVVSSVFQGLAAAPSADPADALAQAQRAFLAAPPSRAYAHPRFWAPFVVLGDGGAPQTALR